MAKKGIKYWTNKVDKVFHRYIRLRDTNVHGYGECITCKTPLHFSKGQAGHFISRAHKLTRWDETNVHLQCARCNCWGGGEQFIYSKELDVMYYEGKADELLRLSRGVAKFSEAEYEDMYLKFKELQDNLESEKEM